MRSAFWCFISGCKLYIFNIFRNGSNSRNFFISGSLLTSPISITITTIVRISIVATITTISISTPAIVSMRSAFNLGFANIIPDSFFSVPLFASPSIISTIVGISIVSTVTTPISTIVRPACYFFISGCKLFICNIGNGSNSFISGSLFSPPISITITIVRSISIVTTIVSTIMGIGSGFTRFFVRSWDGTGNAGQDKNRSDYSHDDLAILPST